VLDDTEAEFDAALDAAVEAAYDDGFEILGFDVSKTVGARSDDLLKAAPQAVREPGPFDVSNSERTLGDGFTERDLDGFDFGLQAKSSVPRQSDSSGFSGTTWHSSSSRATGSSSLSTVAENSDIGLMSNKPPGGLPRLSEEVNRSESPQRPGSQGKALKGTSGSVRSRRLSGQNAKQLKIETQTHKPAPHSKHATPTIPEAPKDFVSLKAASRSQTDLQSYEIVQLRKQSTSTVPNSARSFISPTDVGASISPATPGLARPPPDESSPGGFRFPSARPSFLRKNKSSLSLKNRALSVSSPDGSDASLATPHSTASLSRRAQSHPTLMPPPAIPDITYSTGPHIFKADLHSPHSPGFPNPALPAAEGPAPLEPCPEPILLRPFWLLRCVYQTIANPAGGYLSNRLFVLPQVWNTRGVKLKAVDDKIAACDALTAALVRLAQVDSLDAQAVLDEMQTLEGTLDAVQATLAKKLGHDVGVSATAAFIRDAPADLMAGGAALDHPPLPTGGGATPVEGGGRPNGIRSSSKSYLSSWRKLRSKTSSSALAGMNPPGGASSARDGRSGSNSVGSGGSVGGDDALSAPRMASLPMTPLLNVRFTKRDAGMQLAEVGGANAGYMVSLARLCDAVQVVGEFRPALLIFARRSCEPFCLSMIYPPCFCLTLMLTIIQTRSLARSRTRGSRTRVPCTSGWTCARGTRASSSASSCAGGCWPTSRRCWTSLSSATPSGCSPESLASNGLGNADDDV
jgi:hypothetical protein